jgi:tRNA(fMet)-specific endonuclease VapC
MFLLDTDHLVIAQRNAEPEAGRLRQRMARYHPSDFYLSVVSVHEQMLGASKFVAQAKSRASVVRGYQMIESAILDYNRFHILPFDEPAAIKFDDLRKQGIRSGTMDLRIASIALSQASQFLRETPWTLAR